MASHRPPVTWTGGKHQGAGGHFLSADPLSETPSSRGHSFSVSWLTVLDQVAAALERAHAEASGREVSLPASAPEGLAEASREEWQGVLARLDEHLAGMGSRLDHVTQRMEELAAFLEREERACRDQCAELQETGETLTRLAAHSVS